MPPRQHRARDFVERHGLWSDAQAAAGLTGPAAIDGIGPTGDWQGYWQRTDASKRMAASWTNGH